jgi:myo-inositol 2-dehydrogenase / D-chiro-inositol 1-dehydrogenase
MAKNVALNHQTKTMHTMNRKQFLTTTGTLVASAVLTPAWAAAPGATVRIGLIGVGSRGSVHLDKLVSMPNVRVAAICDLKPDRLEAAQKKVTDAGQPKPFGTTEWKKLLEVKELDAVSSALPVDLHSACYQDVLAAGKDLYAEKPMCLTLRQCDDLIAAEKKSGRIVQIGFQRRADPRFIEPMKLVHAGELGELVEGRVCWSNSWGPLTDWFGRKERSGDWMVEQAVHNWDIMNWANACKPRRAMGLGMDKFFRDKQADRNVHDYYSGVLEYENGVVVNIIHSWVPPRLFDREYSWLIGTKGGVDFNSGKFSYRGNEKEDRLGYAATGNIDNTELAFKAFINSVLTRAPSIAPPAIGREAVQTCLLMREAVYRQRAVTLKDLRA